MNILILFSQPWRVGGAETHVEALIKGMSDHRIFLVVNEGSDEIKLNKLCLVYTNLKIIKIQTRGINVWLWRKDLDRLAKVIIEEKITIITAQQRTAGIWSYFLNRKTGVPYTVTMHDPWHRAKFKKKYSKIFPIIFAVSENLAQNLQANFGFSPEQIKVINNGIDFSAFLPTDKEKARKKLGLPLSGKLILHVSRLSNIKGSVSLKIIDAMQYMVKKNIDVRLIIIGEGPLRAKIEQKVEKFNQRNTVKIEIRDFVDDIITWYNAADILIGEGRVAMEALACHKPVVAIRNTETFIGAIDKKNISYACDVNFDGKDQEVTAERICNEMDKALQIEAQELCQIAEYIKTRLGIDNMVQSYMMVFEMLKK